MEKKPTVYLAYNWNWNDYKVVRVLDYNGLNPGDRLTVDEKRKIVDDPAVHVIVDEPREREHVARRKADKKGGL